MKKVIGLAIAIVMPFAMASALLTSRAPRLGGEKPSAVDVPHPMRAPALPSADDDSDLDLLGNPVTNAVAKYRFDPAGSLYEVHSPLTELPRLAPPKG